MKLAIPTTAAFVLLGCMNAQGHIAKEYINGTQATTKSAEPEIELAMGLVSAPHLPSGPANGPTNPPPCATTADSCPPSHQKTKRPRKHSSSL